MNNLMLNFIQQYSSKVISCNFDMYDLPAKANGDYYDVVCTIWDMKIGDNGLMQPLQSVKKCKVSIDEFNKYKRKQEAVIWE